MDPKDATLWTASELCVPQTQTSDPKPQASKAFSFNVPRLIREAQNGSCVTRFSLGYTVQDSALKTQAIERCDERAKTGTGVLIGIHTANGEEEAQQSLARAFSVLGFKKYAVDSVPEPLECDGRDRVTMVRGDLVTDVWTPALEKFITDNKGQNVVISDVQSPRELDVIKRMGGYMINVDFAWTTDEYRSPLKADIVLHDTGKGAKIVEKAAEIVMLIDQGFARFGTTYMVTADDPEKVEMMDSMARQWLKRRLLADKLKELREQELTSKK